jgi:hypothetical protein
MGRYSTFEYSCDGGATAPGLCRIVRRRALSRGPTPPTAVGPRGRVVGRFRVPNLGTWNVERPTRRHPAWIWAFSSSVEILAVFGFVLPKAVLALSQPF